MDFKSIRTLVTTTLTVALVATGATLAGSVTGTVKYEGAAPKLKPQKMDADPGCAKKHTTAPASEILVLGEGQTMANVFVQIKGVPDKDYPVPSTAVELDQEGCRYVPHVLGVMTDQKIKILNSDGLLHNIHALPEVNQSFNQAMPGSVTEIEKSFSKEEPMFKIKCDVHPWMNAYVAVMSHPYFAVTAKDGKFTIDNLPAGTYEVEAWHERLKTKTASVTVSGDGAQTVDFTFSRPQ